jgi:Xaa-Pro aminopeptidase
VGLGRGKLAHVSAVDGVTTHTAYAGAIAQLSHANFENATDIVGTARYVKGDEEIVALRRAVEIAAAGLEALVEGARPGIAEAALYAQGMRRLMELGSEYFPLTLQAEPIGRLRYRHRNPQMGRTLGSDWVIEAEVNAAWGGQVAQETQTIVLGPIPETYRKAADLQREWFGALLGYLTPGTDVAELGERINAVRERHGLRPSLILQSAGYGDDGPRLRTGDSFDHLGGMCVEPNTVWVCQIGVQGEDGRLQLSWGTSVLVTDQGPIGLVNRQPELVSVG